ncbi:MAG: HEAT repeat domain-containing protein [Acidobacteriaceae bacterium]|nr:HEAT repeat domain-containing protein [Acidobacteriaceae bacterium]
MDLEEGVFHLEIYGDPAAIPVLEQRLARTTDEEQQLELSDTIRDLGQPSEPSTPIDFNIWELYPAQSSPDFGQLNENERLEFLTTGTPAQRAEAAESFQGDEELSPQAKAKLLDLARHDPDPAVRGSCWACFFNATDDPEMRKALLERLQDPETPELERVGVALGLVFHTDQAEVHDALIAAAQNPQTRAKALEGMWRSFNQDFTPEASEHLDDPDPEVRRQAIWMVGYLQIKELAAELRKFFRDDELREDAIHNYACVYPGPLARARTMELLKKIDADAGGLSNAETEWVKAGLDLRLIRAGSKPFFDKEAASEQEPVSVGEKVGRNDPCPCGSGKKYKKCCGQ